MRLADLQRPVMRAIDSVGRLVRANPHTERPPVADHRRSVAPYPATTSKERIPAARFPTFRRQLAFLNAPDHGIGADPPDPGADRKEHHDYRAGSRSGEGDRGSRIEDRRSKIENRSPSILDPRSSPLDPPLSTPLKSERDDEHQPGDQADHPSARQRHDDRQPHHRRGETIEDRQFAANRPPQNQSDRDRRNHFHISGEMIVIHERAERRRWLRARFDHPIIFAVPGETLNQPEDGQGQPEKDQKGSEPGQGRGFGQKVRREQKGDQKNEQNFRYETRRFGVERDRESLTGRACDCYALQNAERDQGDQWQGRRWRDDLQAPVYQAFDNPQNQERDDRQAESRHRPRFDRAERKSGAGHYDHQPQRDDRTERRRDGGTQRQKDGETEGRREEETAAALFLSVSLSLRPSVPPSLCLSA